MCVCVYNIAVGAFYQSVHDHPYQFPLHASIGKLGPSGVGGVLQDSAVNFFGIFSMNVGVMDSNQAELLVVRKALELSSSKD